MNEPTTTEGRASAASVDNRGVPCALGIFKVMRAMERMAAGGVLEVLSTDRASRRDLTRWTERVGHQILEIHEEGNALRPLLRFYIRKKAG